MQYKVGKETGGTIRECHRGQKRKELLVLLVIVCGEICLIFERPGLGVGAFLMLLAGMVYGAREMRNPGLLERVMLGALIIGVIQSGRWTSLSNVVVMLTCLSVLNGATAWRELGSGWRQWLEGWLVFLRPLGVLRNYQDEKKAHGACKSVGRDRLGYVTRVILPALILVIIFGWLLGEGNAVLGNWIQGTADWVERIVGHIELPGAGRIMLWTLIGWVGMGLIYAARPTRISGLVTIRWKELGKRDVMMRGYQWFAVLVAMNLLFLLSSISDVVYLWMSRELPEGISHSRYLHKGVYVLILTTILSALIMGTLTQHAREIRSSRCIRILAQMWIVQNLILISGVFLRLWIYVDAFGYTPKRVYVMLFLVLVIGGFVLLSIALMQLRTMKWLVGGNLILLFCHFFILQLVDVPGMVTGWNLNLYHDGEIFYPESKYFRQIGSHTISCLLDIHRNSQNREDRMRAIADLESMESEFSKIEKRPWQSFQFRDHVNWKEWEDFKETNGSITDQTSPD